MNFLQRRKGLWFSKRFVSLLVGCLVVIVLVTWILYSLLLHFEQIKLRAELERNLDLGAFYLEKELQGITSDLELIASSTVLADYLNEPSALNRRNLEIRFSDFVNLRKRYDQIRILGPDGNEKVRVNSVSGRAVIIPDKDLQDKSHRYYFQQAISLPVGVFYASPLDLNIENEKIEIPFKAMIRVSLKLTDFTGDVAGVLVMNYMADPLIRGLDEVYRQRGGQLLLVNRSGYYLKGPADDVEWGFLITARQKHHLENEAPELWEKIESAPSGFVNNDTGVIAFRSVNPAQLLFNPSVDHVAPQSIFRRWTLVDWLPPETLSGLMSPYLSVLVLGASLLAVLSVLGLVLYSRAAQMRDEYNRQSRQLVTALDESPLGIALARMSGQVEYVNRTFLDITGLRLNEVLGKSAWELEEQVLPAEKLTNIHAAFTVDKTWSERIQIHKKDGHARETEIHFSCLEINDHKDKRLMLVVRDISREVELESQLQQAQKMEAIGQLGAGVAHDFNNLLQIILGSATLVINKLKPEGKIASLLDGIVQAAEKGTSLTGQLLTFSRNREIKSEEIDPDDLVTNILDMIKRLLGEQIDVQFEAAGDNCRLEADQGMLEQALINLCINARDAMNGKGTLSLKSQVLSAPDLPDGVLNQMEHSYWYRLSVKDSGCGIPKDILEKVFEPFFTTKEVGKGTGLGLATVYAIVDRHKGSIKVDSLPGKGTTFDLFFPVNSFASSLPAHEKKGRSVDQLQGSGELILLAEDDVQVREYTGILLEEAGYRVLPAEDGAAAVEQFRQHGDEIDLALLDVVMPQMSGREVFHYIRSRNHSIPVLFVSGHDFNMLEDLDPNQNYLDFMKKPFSPDALLNKIAELVKAKADVVPK